MMDVIACIDGSSYDPGVCEHAARFAGILGARLTLAHARVKALQPAGPSPRAGRGAADLVPAMIHHLADLGVERVGQLEVEGRFPEALQPTLADAAFVVAGKRGGGASMNVGALGRGARQVLAATNAPVCLASRVYLPFSRALVLLEAAPEAEQSLLALAGQTWLGGLAPDVVVTSQGDEDPSSLVAMARERLAPLSAKVFPLPGLGLAGALDAYLARRACELLVLSRDSLLGPGEHRRARLERWTPWDRRASVVVV